MAKKITYSQSGVDYSAMDPIKVLAQKSAVSTAPHLNTFGSHEINESRGESAYVWRDGDTHRSLVIEGLGTKNLIADEMRKVTGKTYYDQIAQDTIAMIVNDLIVVGAMPQVINAYFAIGDSSWMKDEQRASDLINGWARACNDIGATWGGGETPTLKNIIEPQTIDIAGAALGVINSNIQPILGDKLEAGDAVILVESSGIHANGITLIRSLAESSPDIYTTKLSGGRTFGEALLTPTHLYVDLVRQTLEAGIDVHYMVNITGHGWRKLMRATKDLSYVIDKIPPAQEEFSHIQQQAGIDDKEMYGNYNMGAGFAIYVPASSSEQVIKIAEQCGLKALLAGHIENGPKQVVIKPKNITFEGDSLGVR